MPGETLLTSLLYGTDFFEMFDCLHLLLQIAHVGAASRLHGVSETPKRIIYEKMVPGTESAIVARVRFSSAQQISAWSNNVDASTHRNAPQRAEMRRRLTGRTRLTGRSSLTSQPPLGASLISRTQRKMTAKLRRIWAKARGSKASISSLSWRKSV